MIISWTCQHCKKDIEIFVEVESPSDYYPDLNCEYCNKEIKDDELDTKIMEEASEYYVGMAEYYEDR